jgi:hypothetical protein
MTSLPPSARIRCRIELFRKPDGAAVEDQRPSRMVGGDAIILEAEAVGFPLPDYAREIVLRGP